MNEPVYTPMNIAAVAAMSAELDRMKASHQALIDALENCMAQIEGHDPAGCNPAMPYDRLSQARAALKLARGA